MSVSRDPDQEEERLRTAALENAKSILVARQRAEDELIRAKQDLERKTAELAHSLSLMRATLESTSDGILVTDDTGRVTDFNENYAQMWGFPSGIVEARDHVRIQEFVLEQLEPDARPEYRARMKEIYASAAAETFDTLTLISGRVIERTSRIQIANGRNTGRVWCFRDVTEREQLLAREQAARAEAEEASRLKDEFLATASHELRTPLNAIVGWAQILRVGGLDADKAQHAIDVIERNARAQAQVIDDLLDVSRIITGKLRLDVRSIMPASAIESALDSVRPTAEAKGVSLHALLDAQAGPISGDGGRLQQIVWNLLANAIKFTPKGGRVEARLERVSSHVEIVVSDTGEGISPEFLPYVFDRFRQADASSSRFRGGLGLGLAIVRHLVEQHGGTVSATSRGKGEGSVFTVRLPLRPVQILRDCEERVHPRSENAAGHPPSGSPTLDGVRILIVDDELDAREILREVLERCGAEVRDAPSAARAFEIVKAWNPSAMVSDIGMPGEDGYSLIRKVREWEKGSRTWVPAVALTAYARSEDRMRALVAGYQVHIAKPIDPMELALVVAGVIQAGTPRPG